MEKTIILVFVLKNMCMSYVNYFEMRHLQESENIFVYVGHPAVTHDLVRSLPGDRDRPVCPRHHQPGRLSLRTDGGLHVHEVGVLHSTKDEVLSGSDLGTKPSLVPCAWAAGDHSFGPGQRVPAGGHCGL